MTINLADFRPDSKISRGRPIWVKIGLNPYSVCPILLGHTNRMEPFLMSLVAPELFLLSQVNMSAVKKAYLTDRGLNYVLPPPPPPPKKNLLCCKMLAGEGIHLPKHRWK